MLLDARILFPGDICKILSEVSHFTYPNRARSSRPTSASLFPTYRDISHRQLLWTAMWAASHTWHKLNPHKGTMMQVLLTPFYDENLRTKESRLHSYGVTVLGFALNFKPQVLSLSPLNSSNQQLFLLVAAFCSSSSLGPISVFSSIFFMGICLGSLSRLNLLMEGTLFVSFLYPPDNNYCCREAWSLRNLRDLLKVTSNHQRSKFKHKHAKKHQLSFKHGHLQKAYTHQCLLLYESVPTNAILFPRKESCPVGLRMP